MPLLNQQIGLQASADLCIKCMQVVQPKQPVQCVAGLQGAAQGRAPMHIS
jgi:hypothetical protein